MTSLSTRIASAEVGSRELDMLVLAATGHVYYTDCRGGWHARRGHDERIHGDGPSQVTTSLDAALALAERVLPNEIWTCEFGPSGSCVEMNSNRFIIEACAPTPALALCAAILKAVESEK